MGDDREWHFRHKEINPECDHESWLHKFAKLYFKSRFESEETFVVSYWVKDICPQYDHCGLKSNTCFQERLHTVDLKQIYDVCEEEKTNGTSLYRADLKFYNSKDSKTKPLFLEIAYTHDCKLEKIASGIQIIELKIEKEEDLEKPIIEPRQLMMDYNNGYPYSFCQLPDIRFYNFERVFKKSMSKELSLFVLSKDDNHKIVHGLLGEDHKIGCDIFDKINNSTLLYSLAVPADYIKMNPSFDMWGYGLFKAASHGILFRNCLICKKCYAGPGGCVRYGKYMANLLGAKEINKDKESQNCREYQPYNTIELKRLLSKFSNVPHEERINK